MFYVSLIVDIIVQAAMLHIAALSMFIIVWILRKLDLHPPSDECRDVPLFKYMYFRALIASPECGKSTLFRFLSLT